jgi:GNAT superfamily N-acetyltransferase
MDKITFHKAAEQDLALLVDYRIVFSDELAGKQDEKVEMNLRQNLNSFFKTELNKTYFCWYAKVNDDVAAIAGMGIREQPGNIKNPSGRWGYIMSVYTVPEHRRKGLSAALLDKLIETGRELGVTAFELHATKEGEPVYVKNGFIVHSEPTYRKFI